MTGVLRGADVLVRALSAAGVGRLFTLSGNQIMSVFDASIDAGIELVHVRHEAAAVHMADAWGRLTGEPGVALVTAGPGLANTLSALYVAMMAESPMVLLSGHAPHDELGRGAFQEMAQAEMAGQVAKASWTATEASGLGRDLARAFGVATSGRPGPVHISLPFNLLESAVQATGDPVPGSRDFRVPTDPLDDHVAQRVLDALADASKPLVLAGPTMMRGAGPGLLSRLAQRAYVPAVCMESPRGINDPSLGAFAEMLPEADLIVLLGKKLDFTLRFGEAPDISPECRFIHLDPETAVLDQTRRALSDSSRLVLAEVADPLPAAERLLELAQEREWASRGWYGEVRAAVSYRPAEWATLESPPGGPLHALEVCRAVQTVLEGRDRAVFVSDGGEFGQWAQACIGAPNRIINGPGGAIGGSIPSALAARFAFPDSPVITVLGDGSFGFHALEFDTAVRHGLPFVAVVGNDAAWNAEYQIQLRTYGPDRLVGCELLASRYDRLVEALGGHGEYVSTASGLGPALQRALASGRPACVNVSVQRAAAPVIRRPERS